MGSKDDMGLLKKIVVYVILVCVGFIFVYPIAQIFATSFMSVTDLADSSINWIPTKLSLDNYIATIGVLDYWNALIDSILISGVPTICQVVVCALVGYGLARYDFKGKKLMMLILIISFIIPTQIMNIPIFWVYSQLKLTGSIFAFIMPAAFAQGFKSQLFILICWSFFKQIPKVLNEAAQIDGAGHMKQFYRIAIPSAKGALVVVFLFSFVWYWNEDYLTRLYLYKSGKTIGDSILSNFLPEGLKDWTTWTPVINQLQIFDAVFNTTVTQGATAQGQSGGSSGVPSINVAYSMAATILSIAPLLIMYLVLQKQFVESVDRAGITGE
ncbi:MAG: carbohydrate ABC transporter permease [Lachnospiraceae bacterium]|nr:carbohydrate ABC transporter permease [Lachnospiraceae bacterium]